MYLSFALSKTVLSLSDDKEAVVIVAFASMSRYLSVVLNNDNPYFESMANRINPPELQLHVHKINTFDTETPF